MFTGTLFVIVIFGYIQVAVTSEVLGDRKGNVFSVLPDGFDSQVLFRWRETAKVIRTSDHELSSPSGQVVIKLQCESYENEVTRVMVYTTAGVLIDHAALMPTTYDPCLRAMIKNIVSPQDPTEDEKGKISIQYMWSGKVPSCATRKYTVIPRPLRARVSRSGVYREECSPAVAKFIRSFNDRRRRVDTRKAGGVVSLGFIDGYISFEFNNNVKTPGTPSIIPFPKKDLKRIEFKLICREDVADVEDRETKDKIITGTIVHGKYDGVVLEKFKMKECKTDYINVNRQIWNGYDHYKTVFMGVTGLCFEREYDFLKEEPLFYHSRITVIRKPRKKVKCPDSFVGDIGMNAEFTWYTWFWGKEPYGREITDDP